MIAEKTITSLDKLMQELILHAKEVWPPGESSALWEMTGSIAWERCSRSVWQWISKAFLKDVGRVYDQLRPFAICNLAR
jgi:hypothetical protein